MVNAFQKYSASASGLDINDNAIQYARSHFPRCNFYSSSFHIFQPTETYGFVYSSELIEHVRELEIYMQVIKRLTRAGSYVYITTPDIGSKNVPNSITEWDVFSPPHHVQFFKERNLELLFRRHGFKQIKRFSDKKAGLKVLFERAA